MELLLVCLGAAVGAPARYLVDRAMQARHDTVMPWGTLVVNVVGSLVLGLLTGLAVNREVPHEVLLGIGTGLCGTLTTYSTFSFETLRLHEEGATLYALANVAVSLTAGMSAAVGGYAVGTLL
jgi:CrcB protein